MGLKKFLGYVSVAAAGVLVGELYHSDKLQSLGIDRHHAYEWLSTNPENKTSKNPKKDAPLFAGVDLTDRLQSTDSVFLIIDASGSMAGEPLERAKSEAKSLVKNIPENKKVNIITYGTEVHTWKENPVSATSANKNQIYNWVNGITILGDTATAEAVSTALNMEPKTKYIILLTDGAPTDCELPEDDCLNKILESNEQGAKIDTFGIGAQGPWENFLKSLASKTKGRYTKLSVDTWRSGNFNYLNQIPIYPIPNMSNPPEPEPTLEPEPAAEPEQKEETTKEEPSLR